MSRPKLENVDCGDGLNAVERSILTGPAKIDERRIRTLYAATQDGDGPVVYLKSYPEEDALLYDLAPLNANSR